MIEDVYANSNPNRQTRDYNRGDWESIRRDLHAISWKPLLEGLAPTPNLQL